MHASDFINKRTRIVKAFTRGIIDTDQFHEAMHALFVEAQVSKGFVSDIAKSTEIVEAHLRAQLDVVEGALS